MQAAWYSKIGEAADVLEFGEQPTPEPLAGEVRVKLVTSGVNPSDVKSRRARPVTDPLIIPHSDGAGVIDAVGDGVSSKRIGERVWAWNAQWKRALGTASEFICLPQAQAVTLPELVSFEAGACFGIPALTAIEAVRLAGDLKNKTVLVIGGASAVGHYITQLVVLAGGRVLATIGSAAKAAHAKDAGASDVVNYKTEPVAERVKQLTYGAGVDIIIDMDLSTTTQLLTQGCLKPHGQLVCYGSNVPGDVPINFRTLLYASIGLKFFLVYDLSEDARAYGLQRFDALLHANSLKHTIGATFPLKDLVKAHQMVETGQVLGNVVVQI